MGLYPPEPPHWIPSGCLGQASHWGQGVEDKSLLQLLAGGAAALRAGQVVS